MTYEIKREKPAQPGESVGDPAERGGAGVAGAGEIYFRIFAELS